MPPLTRSALIISVHWALDDNIFKTVFQDIGLRKRGRESMGLRRLKALTGKDSAGKS